MSGFKQPNERRLQPVEAVLIDGALYVKETDARRAIEEAMQKARAFDMANKDLIHAAPVMETALEAISKALCDTKDEEYHTARAFLDQYDIYHKDLSAERVLLAVAQTALQIANGERQPVRHEIVTQLEREEAHRVALEQ